MPDQANRKLSPGEILQLARWNTPTVYNGWEQITSHDAARDCFNLEEVHDFMPGLGSMVGYAVTVVCEPSNRQHKLSNPNAGEEYRRYLASIPGPKIVVVQDLDRPHTYGSFWGEVNANTHRALGCVGTIVDGAIRDLEEMQAIAFKALARQLCVGHAYSTPVRWNCDVEVFGVKVRPGQLIHADMHGFLVIPDEDVDRLLDATQFMDRNECDTVIAAAKSCIDMPTSDVLQVLEDASVRFNAAAKHKFSE